MLLATVTVRVREEWITMMLYGIVAPRLGREVHLPRIGAFVGIVVDGYGKTTTRIRRAGEAVAVWQPEVDVDLEWRDFNEVGKPSTVMMMAAPHPLGVVPKKRSFVTE